MKSRNILIFIAVIIIFAGIVTGYIFNNDINKISTEKKPIIETVDQAKLVNPNTHIDYQIEYLKCGHKVASSFNRASELVGKDLEDIRRSYGIKDGYRISWQGQSLVIYQQVNDYCPADKNRYRLKEYKGMVAIYRGTEEEEVLERVTEIPMDLLPASVQEDIRNGKFEFQDRATLNDALENFDEFL